MRNSLETRAFILRDIFRFLSKVAELLGLIHEDRKKYRHVVLLLISMSYKLFSISPIIIFGFNHPMIFYEEFLAEL